MFLPCSLSHQAPMLPFAILCHMAFSSLTISSVLLPGWNMLFRCLESSFSPCVHGCSSLNITGGTIFMRSLLRASLWYFKRMSKIILNTPCMPKGSYHVGNAISQIITDVLAAFHRTIDPHQHYMYVNHAWNVN